MPKQRQVHAARAPQWAYGSLSPSCSSPRSSPRPSLSAGNSLSPSCLQSPPPPLSMQQPLQAKPDAPGRNRRLGQDQTTWSSKSAQIRHQGQHRCGAPGATPLRGTRGNTAAGHQGQHRCGAPGATPLRGTRGNTAAGHQGQHRFGAPGATPLRGTRGNTAAGRSRHGTLEARRVQRLGSTAKAGRALNIAPTHKHILHA
eukprot:356737-Chlamydomonas_euryale.AAC.1